MNEQSLDETPHGSIEALLLQNLGEDLLAYVTASTHVYERRQSGIDVAIKRTLLVVIERINPEDMLVDAVVVWP